MLEGEQVLRLGWFGYNPTLYLVLPGDFIRGESRITDLALDLWESTNRVFCEKLEEGFKAVVCGTISKQALQRAGETSKKNG